MSLWLKTNGKLVVNGDIVVDCPFCPCAFECAGACQPGTTPLEWDLEFRRTKPDPLPDGFCDIFPSCDSIEGQTVRLQQDGFDPCHWCVTIAPFCNTGSSVLICWDLFLVGGGGGSNTTWGRLTITDANGDSALEVRMESGAAPRNCLSTFGKTMRSSTSTLVVLSTFASEHGCNWMIGNGWRYRIDPVPL